MQVLSQIAARALLGDVRRYVVLGVYWSYCALSARFDVTYLGVGVSQSISSSRDASPFVLR